MLANCVDDIKTILILQKGMFSLMLFCKRLLKQKKGIPRYGKTTYNSFLGGQYDLQVSVQIVYLKTF